MPQSGQAYPDRSLPSAPSPRSHACPRTVHQCRTLGVVCPISNRTTMAGSIATALSIHAVAHASSNPHSRGAVDPKRVRVDPDVICVGGFGPTRAWFTYDAADPSDYSSYLDQTTSHLEYPGWDISLAALRRLEAKHGWLDGVLVSPSPPPSPAAPNLEHVSPLSSSLYCVSRALAGWDCTLLLKSSPFPAPSHPATAGIFAGSGGGPSPARDTATTPAPRLRGFRFRVCS